MADKTLLRQTVHHIIIRLYIRTNYELLSVLYQYGKRDDRIELEDLMDPNLDIQSEWTGDKLKITVTINE